MRCLACFLLAGALPIAAQLGMVTSGGCSGAGGTLSVQVGPRPVSMHVVTGKPYSARETSETVETVANGAHVVHEQRSQPMTWRDSKGRVRWENNNGSCLDGFYRIGDPVAGYAYVIDPIHLVAHRMALEVREPRTPPQRPPRPSDPAVTTEPLGEKTISGVKVTGTKTTKVFPPGSRMNNDAPVTTVSEEWIAPSLGLVVYAKTSGPGDTASISELKDLKAGEPSPELFQVPDGYKIVDETKSFTITIPAK